MTRSLPSFIVIALAAGVACANLDGLADGKDAGAAPSKSDAGSIVTTGGLLIKPAVLDFDARCGGTAAAQEVVVTNPTTEAKALSITAPAVDLYRLTGDTAITSLAAGASAHIQVSPVIGAAPGGAQDDLAFVTDAAVDNVRLDTKIHGAALTISPDTLDFGIIHTDVASGELPFAIQNSGDEPVTLTGFANLGQEFVMSGLLGSIVGGQSLGLSSSMTAGQPGAPTTILAVAQVNAQLCGGAPMITLKGQRSSSAVIVSPAALDFGSHGCRTTPAQTAKVTISNYSLTATVAYTAVLNAGKDSPFTIGNGGAAGMVAVGSATTPAKLDITVGLANTGATPAAVKDTLKVTVTPQNGTATVIPVALTHLVTGVSIELVDKPKTFGTSQNRVQSPKIKNMGNVATCVKYTLAGPNGSSWSVEPDDSINPGASNGVDLTFEAVNSGNYSATVTMTPIACANGGTAIQPPAFCTPAPTLSLAGSIGPVFGQ